MKSTKFASQGREAPQPKEFVDLHMHSTFSDGTLPVRDLIDYCLEQGLNAIAVTDHDNIDSFEDGREYAESRGLEFIPGVEISSSIGGSDIHILGYMFDPTHLRLNRTLVELRARRVDRAKAILERLEKRGLSLSYEQVAARAHGGSIGRAHIAAQLVDEEYVATFQDAFNLYLGNDAELMSDMDAVKLNPAEAIELILDAGGVPVLAHPCKTNRDDLLEMLVECGLKGIETYCHGLSHANSQKYRSFAQKRNLICTGGADFHVKRPDGRNAPGSLRIPYRVLSQIKEAKVGAGASGR
ncbi:MAG: PHP domain-containing protein [Fibrobacteres bacterium]|jgi:predicted metal-dependent phosphoesterase TrpH|nr:PHP domain-containing protein [Fibrobacterota bacterium]